MSLQSSNTRTPPIGDGATTAKILVLTVAGIGDFVLGTPALHALRHGFPHTEIWILTIPEVAPLADRCPYVDVVRTLDLRRSRSALAWILGPARRELLPLISELRATRFDTALNLYAAGTRAGRLRMSVFLWSVGARRTVGRHHNGLGGGLPGTSSQNIHEIDAQLGIARLVGATATDPVPELWVRPADRTDCAVLLKRYGISDQRQLVCLSPGSDQGKKRWPAERFAAVGQRLAEAGARVALIGSRSEHVLCDQLVQEIPGAISLAGETSLPVLAALLELSRLLVTNDSGPMHMAAALGVPLVVAFGPAAPDRFGPRGRGIHLVFAAIGQPGRGSWWEEVRADAVSEAAVRLYVETAARTGAPGRDA